MNSDIREQENTLDLSRLTESFIEVARLAGVNSRSLDLEINKLYAPHVPPSTLPNGKMAVYVFFWNERCLKVGKVGPKSKARYTSQHYSPSSSNSNLAKSLLKNANALGLTGLLESNVGEWIKTNTFRVNFVLDVQAGMSVLTLLEAFLQCRLNPIFEGFESQKQ